MFAASAVLDVENNTLTFASVPHGFRAVESSDQLYARRRDVRLWPEDSALGERRLKCDERTVDSYMVKMLGYRITVDVVACKRPFPKCLA